MFVQIFDIAELFVRVSNYRCRHTRTDVKENRLHVTNLRNVSFQVYVCSFYFFIDTPSDNDIVSEERENLTRSTIDWYSWLFKINIPDRNRISRIWECTIASNSNAKRMRKLKYDRPPAFSVSIQPCVEYRVNSCRNTQEILYLSTRIKI